MLPNETQFKQSGTLQGEDIKMTFDEDSLEFLQGVLTDLYSDRELAVIREYSTNARDSHIAAGQTRPIEIVTPTALAYYFKVKDYGVGLSKDDITNIYSKYGASTKRVTNDQVGMLGLGCKAALTYSDRFTIIAVKDSVKIMVDISRSESGGGVMSILSEEPTTEPNGVEIIVPVSRDNDFADKAQNFFKYWSEGEVLINGKPPIDLNLIKVTDKIYVKEDPGWYEKSYLVMGGVPYEIDSNQIKLPKGFVGFVDIGEVSFVPSREHLHYTNKTLEALNRLKIEYIDNIMISAQRGIDEATDYVQVAVTFHKWERLLRDQGITVVATDFTYKGQELNIYVEFNGRWIHGDGFMPPGNYSLKAVAIENLPRSYTIVTGFENHKLTAWQRKKLNHWAEQNNVLPSFYFCKDLPGNGWLAGVRTVSWQDILAIKLPSQGGKTAAEPTYDGWHCGAKTPIILDANKPIWYSTKSRWRELTSSFNLREGFADVQFVFVGQNRLKKFLTKYPTAIDLKQGLINYVQSYLDNLSDQDRAILGSTGARQSNLMKLDQSKVVDPDLCSLIELNAMTDDVQAIQQKRQYVRQVANTASSTLAGQIVSLQAEDASWITDRYPLIDTILQSLWRANDKYWNHIYLYLNAAYDEYKNTNEKDQNEFTV